MVIAFLFIYASLPFMFMNFWVGIRCQEVIYQITFVNHNLPMLVHNLVSYIFFTIIKTLTLLLFISN